MNRALWIARRATALLAGLLIVLNAAAPSQAYEPALDPDLAWVPPDATAFITVRAADLAEKFGLTDKSARHPWASAWQKQVGIPLNQVERCTFVKTGEDATGSCLIILTNKPYKHADVLKACVPDARDEKHSRKLCHVSVANKTAVHFATERILLVGDTDSVVRCLAQAARSRAGAEALTEVLGSAGPHDVVVWNRATHKDMETMPPATTPRSSTSSYKVPLSRAAALGRTVTVSRKPSLSAAFETGSSARQAEPQMELSFLPVPLPAGVECGSISVDVGEQLNIEMRLICADETSARKSAKMMRALIGLARAEMLAAVSEMDMIEALPSMASGADMAALPVKLMRQAEKGLQDARVRIDGKAVPVSVVIPVDTKALRSEMASLMKLSESCGDGSTCSPGAFFKSVVEGNLLQASGPAAGAAVGDPLMPAATPVPPTAYSTTSPAPGGPLATEAKGAVYGAVLTPTPPGGAYGNLMRAGPVDQPMEGSTIAASPREATIAVKLTVANVRKETALLFTIGDNGKLTFVQKVPPGEAIDVQTMSGQSWIAIFADKPAGEAFKPGKATETWLLRGEAPPQPYVVDPATTPR